MKNRGGSINNHPAVIGNNHKKSIAKHSGQTYAESTNSGDREGHNDLAQSHKVSTCVQRISGKITENFLTLLHRYMIITIFITNANRAPQLIQALSWKRQ